jgi:hypothetical protein
MLARGLADASRTFASTSVRKAFFVELWTTRAHPFRNRVTRSEGISINEQIEAEADLGLDDRWGNPLREDEESVHPWILENKDKFAVQLENGKWLVRSSGAFAVDLTEKPSVFPHSVLYTAGCYYHRFHPKMDWIPRVKLIEVDQFVDEAAEAESIKRLFGLRPKD